MTEIQRAMNWLGSGDTGLSSEAIMIHMLGGQPARASYPSDPDDLGRCLRLLELLPEWKPRINEMAAYGYIWAALGRHWGELTALMGDDASINWSRTRNRMKAIELEGLKADPEIELSLSADGNDWYGWRRKA